MSMPPLELALTGNIIKIQEKSGVKVELRSILGGAVHTAKKTEGLS